jgi:hypothetical protein
VPTVRELTALYEGFMVSPRAGTDVCGICFNFTDGYTQCFACANQERWLDAVAPISYSVAREQLHHALASYKRLSGGVARRIAVELAAVLWRYLAGHEQCVARASRTAAFELVTTVPSGGPVGDDGHPLRTIVAELVAPTRDRYERLVRRSNADLPPHEFDRERYLAIRPLAGESVLLIDDTWTTGANAQSAAAALKAAGAGPTAAVVIGRHLNREWHQNDRRLREMSGLFDWRRCALCAQAGPVGDASSRSDTPPS